MFDATEIDSEWTFVAGEQGLIERLLGDVRLEAARTTFDAAANHAAEPKLAAPVGVHHLRANMSITPGVARSLRRFDTGSSAD